MKDIVDAILAEDTPKEEFAALPVPESYRATVVRGGLPVRHGGTFERFHPSD